MLHKGTCHCKAIEFEIDSDLEKIMQCNCSICIRKNAKMIMVPKSNFKLLKGKEDLSLYQFNLKLADHFITFANTKNKTIKSTDLNYIMLYAAARYSAHVGKNVLEIENHEDYVKHMSEQFIDMVREHLADPNL